MQYIRRFFSSIPKYLLWAVLSTLFWMWIFTLITNTTADKKVVLYADVPALEDPALAVKLEESMPEGIKMVKAHAFSYLMFIDAEIAGGDLYIVRGSDIPSYSENLAPLPASYAARGETAAHEGVIYGLRIYDAASKTGAASSYITYTGGDREAEDYYLCFGISSVHCGELDEAAFVIADTLLSLQ